MTGSMLLLDAPRERGFTPDDSDPWFDLPVERRMVRVEIDDGKVIVYAADRHGVPSWEVTLSGGTPPAVLVTVVNLAIADAAVTP